MRLTKQTKEILDSQVNILKDISNLKDDEIMVNFRMLSNHFFINNKNLDCILLNLKTMDNVVQTSCLIKDEILVKYLKDKVDSSNQYECKLSEIESNMLDDITATESEVKLLNAIVTKIYTFTSMYKFYSMNENTTYVCIKSNDFSLITKNGDYLINPNEIRFKFKGDILPSLENYYNYTYTTIQELILNNGYATA